MKIYQPTIQQASKLQKLCVQTILHSCQQEYTSEQLRVWSQAVDSTTKWERLLQEQYFLVAEKQEELVGFGSLKEGNYIDYLYVSHQHLRQGVAQTLLEELLVEAKKKGASSITTDASKTAWPFFEREGFQLLQVNHPVLDGIALEHYTVIKELL